jgi:hypothetical protein
VTRSLEAQPQIQIFSDIRDVLQDLDRISHETQADADRTHRDFLLLRGYFETLTVTAETIMARLEKAKAADAGACHVVQEAEEFITELVLTADRVEATADIGTHDNLEMRSLCRRLYDWSQVFRERARPLITDVLNAIARINDRRIHRIDRAGDFQRLARWFAQAESDADAHRLWQSAFGLRSARHLSMDDADPDDAVSADTSWIDSPPLRISRQPRRAGDLQMGMLSRIVDRTAEKGKLAAAAQEEAVRLLNAHSRLTAGSRVRLSELEHLDSSEFDILLGHLGEEAVEIVSGDGALSIKLEPTGDGRNATIATSGGMFSGPDHWISISRSGL